MYVNRCIYESFSENGCEVQGFAFLFERLVQIHCYCLFWAMCLNSYIFSDIVPCGTVIYFADAKCDISASQK